MAAETEIERLIVRLVGDATAYQSMLRDSVSSTQSAVGAINSSTQQISASTVAMGTMVADAIEGIARKMIALGETLVREAVEREEVMIRFGATVKRQGGDVQALTEDYKKFAQELGTMTATCEDANLALVQQALTYDLSGNAAKRAVRNALAIAGGNSEAAASYLRMTARLEKGIVGYRMGMIFPGVNKLGTDAEKVEYILKKLAEKFAVTQQLAEGFGGRMRAVGLAMEDLRKDFGGLLIQMPLVDKWFTSTKAIEWVRGLSKETKQCILVLGGAVAALGGIGIALKIINISGMITGFAALAKGMLFLLANPLSTAYVAMWLAAAAAVAVFSGALDPVLEKIALLRFPPVKPTEYKAPQVENLTSEQRAAAEKLHRFRAGVMKEAESRPLTEEERSWVTTINARIKTYEEASNAAGIAKVADEEYAKSIQEVIDKADKEAQQAGLTKAEIEDLALAELGASEVVRQHVKAQLEKADAMRKVADLTKSVENAIKSMDEDIATMGMGANEKKAWSLIQEGADEGLLDYGMATDIMKELFDERKKAIDDGKRITDELMTPQEKFAKTQADLSKLLNVGAIDQTTYARAVEKARIEMEKLTEATSNFNGEVDIAGSARGLKNLEKYMDSLGRGTALKLPPPPSDFVQKPAIPENPEVQPDAFGRRQAREFEDEQRANEVGRQPIVMDRMLPLMERLVNLAEQHWTGDAVEIMEKGLVA